MVRVVCVIKPHYSKAAAQSNSMPQSWRARLDEVLRHDTRGGSASDPHGPAVVHGQLLLRCLNFGIHAVVGMKMRIGVESRSRLVNSAAEVANMHDQFLSEDLLHGGKRRV